MTLPKSKITAFIDTTASFVCFVAVVTSVVFFVWWWWEDFSISALPGMLLQLQNLLASEYGTWGVVAKVLGGLFVLVLLFWAFFGNVNEKRTSNKKRWIFVVLGLIFGLFGGHLAYARRWKLFCLQWGVFLLCCGIEESSFGKTAHCRMIVEYLRNAWFLLVVAGILFIKKDGDGDRM